jgi:hypothetical protein
MSNLKQEAAIQIVPQAPTVQIVQVKHVSTWQKVKMHLVTIVT